MENFFGIQSKKRDAGREPGGINLFRGLAFIAVGIIGISSIATPVPMMWKLIFGASGLIFGGIGGMWMKKYVSAYRAFRQFVPVWDRKRGMYDQFAEELNTWYQDGILPACCDGDTACYLELQRERIQQKGLTMNNQVMPVKGRSFGTAVLSRKSAWYTTDMTYEEINRTLRFENSQGTVYERNVEQVMYEVIAHTPNDAQLSHIRITCPNCGALNRVETLEKGCPYCDTRFRMTELFPRVVNLYFLKSKSSASMSGMMTRTTLFCMGVVFLVVFALMIGKDGVLPAKLAVSFFAAGFGGGILGYFLAALRLLFSAFDRDGMKHVSVFKWSSSKKKITNYMRRYDSNFSFDKFEGQVVALIRMAVFAEHPERLACYRGGQRDAGFDDILEMTYTNATCLKDMRMEGDILHMSLRTWWVNYSEHQGKVGKTGDCIDVELSRNVSAIEPPGFSITSVACPNCGGSFDAVRQKICPHCESEYHMENEGWVIDNMRLIR